MKIPNIFVPEKDLGNTTNSLLNSSKRRALERLILRGWEFSNFVKYENLVTTEFYPTLAKSKIDEAIYVDYNPSIITDDTIDIIKFNDKDYLSKNKSKIKKIIKEHNSRNASHDLRALIKDEYLVFVHADEYFRTKAVDVYKQRFGFEEVK